MGDAFHPKLKIPLDYFDIFSNQKRDVNYNSVSSFNKPPNIFAFSVTYQEVSDESIQSHLQAVWRLKVAHKVSVNT